MSTPLIKLLSQFEFKFIEVLWFIKICDFTWLRSFPVHGDEMLRIESLPENCHLFTEIICKHFSQFFTARKSILSRTAISLLYEFVQTRNKRMKFISEIRQSPCYSSMWTFMFHLSMVNFAYMICEIFYMILSHFTTCDSCSFYSQSWLLVVELNLVMGSTICLDIRRDF